MERALEAPYKELKGEWCDLIKTQQKGTFLSLSQGTHASSAQPPTYRSRGFPDHSTRHPKRHFSFLRFTCIGCIVAKKILRVATKISQRFGLRGWHSRWTITGKTGDKIFTKHWYRNKEWVGSADSVKAGRLWAMTCASLTPADKSKHPLLWVLLPLP